MTYKDQNENIPKIQRVKVYFCQKRIKVGMLYFLQQSLRLCPSIELVLEDHSRFWTHFPSVTLCFTNITYIIHLSVLNRIKFWFFNLRGLNFCCLGWIVNIRFMSSRSKKKTIWFDVTNNTTVVIDRNRRRSILLAIEGLVLGFVT